MVGRRKQMDQYKSNDKSTKNYSEEGQLASDIAIHVYEMAKLSIGGLENKDIATFQTRNAELLGKLMQKFV